MRITKIKINDKVEANYDSMNYRRSHDDNYALLDHLFNKMILSTNDFDQARQEAIEWAEYDDLAISVVDQRTGSEIIFIDGYEDACEMLEEEED